MYDVPAAIDISVKRGYLQLVLDVVANCLPGFHVSDMVEP